LEIPIPRSGAGVRGLSGRREEKLANYFPIIIIPSHHLAHMVIVTIMGKT
jgi:hypothetical protein